MKRATSNIHRAIPFNLVQQRLKIQFRHFLRIVIFLSSNLALCQTLPFHSYSIRDGLISNQINSLFQDSRGYLWIGTSEGISVFDGTTFTNIYAADGLSLNFINTIIEDQYSPGTIYIATNGGGLNIWKNGLLRTIQIGETWATNSINSLFVDNSHKLWCGTDDGTFIVDGSSVTNYNSKISFPNIHLIFQARDGNLWICSSFEISIISPDRTPLQHIMLDLNQEYNIRSVFIKNDSTLYIGATDGSIFEFHNRQLFTRYRFPFGPIHFFTVDQDNNLLVGTTQGILEFQDGNVQEKGYFRYTVENGLPDNFIVAGLYDKEHDLLFGSYSKGLIKLVDESVSFIPLGQQSLRYNNQGAVVDKRKHWWIVSNEGLWELWQNTHHRWDKFLHTVSSSSGIISCLSMAGDDSLLIAQEKGLFTFLQIIPQDGEHSMLVQASTFSFHLPPLNTFPLCFIIDQNNLWCSFSLTGVTVIDLKTKKIIKTLTEKDGLPTLATRALLKDHNGNIWFGDYGDGLSVLPGGDLTRQVITFTKQNGLPDNQIRTLFEDSHQNLWVGTRYGGLGMRDSSSSIENSQFHSVLTVNNGLLSNAIWNFCEDNLGNFWAGTHSGLQKITNGKYPKPVLHRDLMGSQIVGCGTTKDGIVWAINPEGVLLYNYQYPSSANLPPGIFINKVTVHGDRVTPLNNKFSYEQNDFVFEYAGISLKHGNTLRYSYRLNGIDQQWNHPTNQRAVTYASLIPGNYEFQVKAVTDDGLESISPASFSFSIAPPFWKRWWFIAGALLMVNGFLFLLYRYKVARIVEVERLRVRIASDLHDDVGSTLTKISVHSELVQSTNDREEIQTSVRKIGTMSRELITTMSDLVWSIDARNDTVGNMIDRMQEFASDLLLSKQITFNFETSGLPLDKKLPVDLRQNIYFIYKEALNNSVKYSEATSVDVRLQNDEHGFSMTIRDNGKGFEKKKSGTGHGLRNMRMRTERIHGEIEYIAEQGTSVILRTKSL